MHRLNKKQIDELFSMAKNAKQNKESLVDVFEFIAKKYGMAKGSVRNIYYRQLKEQNSIRDLSAKKVVAFKKEEEEQMLKEVLLARKSTSSMREAFLTVANGDKRLAMRYQNKYSNMLKKRRSFIMREVLLQKQLYGECFNPYMAQSNQLKRKKLKKEIDALIQTITQKCAPENQMLKRKLIEYEKLNLTSENFSDLISEKQKSGAESFFKSKIKERAKGKVRWFLFFI